MFARLLLLKFLHSNAMKCCIFTEVRILELFSVLLSVKLFRFVLVLLEKWNMGRGESYSCTADAVKESVQCDHYVSPLM